MRHNKKAFTLVEMLVALAVSAVIVSATYASFELIKNQYKKNIDVTQLHTSGRAIMQVLEREIRMAGYEFRDDKGLMTYGKIIGPLALTDSGNKCCDEVTIIYDEVTDTLNSQGVVPAQSGEVVFVCINEELFLEQITQFLQLLELELKRLWQIILRIFKLLIL
jgi:prepilin-type N-terminal cleavage/methylation domain-containing protein